MYHKLCFLKKSKPLATDQFQVLFWATTQNYYIVPSILCCRDEMKKYFPFVLPITISAQPKHAKSCAVWPWLCIFHFILAFYKWNLLHICKICKIVISIRNLMHGSALESHFDGLSNAIIGSFNKDKLKMVCFEQNLNHWSLGSSFEGLWNRIIGLPNWDVPNLCPLNKSQPLLTNSRFYSGPPPKITILYLPFYAAVMKWKNIFPLFCP